ncbi:MAG: sugar phosphate isomerase/epimerase [Planctomycetota bacterium]
MILAYNTNGLAHHRLVEAMGLCADLGYGGVAITLDVAALDPFGDWAAQAREVRACALDRGLAVAVESGARFLLDPQRKHRPNLMDADAGARARRVDFYLRCLEVAHAIGAPLVSLWSGATDSEEDLPEEAFYERLTLGLLPVLRRGIELGVRVSFEPEPGMFVETPEQYGHLLAQAGTDLDDLGLTLDVGHCLVTGESPPQDALRTWRESLWHVHLDDCPRGLHEHRMFGEGDLDLPAVMGALREIDFHGMAAVELSRDSHRGADAARMALKRLLSVLA